MDDARTSLRVLLELTRRLSAEEPLQDSLEAVTHAALRLAPARHSSIRLFDESGTRLVSSARSGEGLTHAPAEFRPGEGLIGWVAEQGARLRLDDAEADARFEQKPGQGFEVRSYLAVPIWAAGQVIGVLSLSSPQPAVFTEDHELLIQLLGNCTIPFIESARLRQLAITDDHTRTFNRRYLLPRLRRELERARTLSTPVTLLSLDLDRFKHVNDTYGHSGGDTVLLDFVERVLENVRSRDAFVRRGGDEFVLIMPGAPLEQARRVAERIRRAVASHPLSQLEGEAVCITVTLGVASFDGDESAEALEGRADRAMYEGKHQGRNCVVVDEAPARPTTPA